MSEAELIDVRVDVREVEVDDLYVDLLDQEYAAVEEGAALIVRIEATIVPAGPGVPVVEGPPWDYALPKPVSWEAVERAIDDALRATAEFHPSRTNYSISGEGLKAVASVTVHGDLPRPPK